MCKKSKNDILMHTIKSVNVHSHNTLRKVVKIMGKDLKGKELGKGLLQRKDGRYCGRIQINGQSICKYDFSLPALKKALQEERLKVVQKQFDEAKCNMTLDEWFQTWFENYKAPILKGTGVKYKRQYVNYFGSRIGSKPLNSIIQLDVQMAVSDLLDAGRSPKTIREAVGILRQIYETANANGLCSKNPALGVVIPEGIPPKRRVLTRAEQNEFVHYLDSVNHWYKEMYKIMITTGMRVGEIGGLRWSDIDFENGFIHIRQAYVCQYEDGKKTSIMTSPKTYNSVRSIPFFGETKELLLAWRNKTAFRKKQLGARYRLPEDCEDIIFVTSMGSLVARHNVESDLRKVTEMINAIRLTEASRNGTSYVPMENINPHALRHTFATRCLEKGMNPRIVQEIMGHANYQTTISYSHVIDDMKQVEAQRLGNFLEVTDFAQMNKRAEYERLAGLI